MSKGRIIKRLLGQPATETHSDTSQAVFDSPRVEGSILRPTSSQHANLRVSSPLICLDKSPKGGYAVIAGEGVFKTIKVDGSTISDEIDLRAAISSQVSTHDNTLSAFNDQLNIRTVRWSHGELDTTIITASANGRVTLYDLNRIGSGVEIGRIREHARQVHKLAVNPFRGNWLLSASQDGTARLFDIKTAALGRTGQTFHSWSVFRCNADAVRDIKWSPMDGFKFACSTASGTVLQWDTRKPTVPVHKINAHDSACLSISWHPDGEHLLSGGLDQQCHVWDMAEKENKRQKPKYTIATPAPVSIVSWRPACWSSTAQAKRAAQAVVVYDDANPMRIQNSTVHIWDVARPSLPFKEITDFETSPTGLLWHERDLLWTVGREGDFTQTDVAFAPKVIDSRSLSTFDFSPSGEVLMLLEERQETIRPRPHVIAPLAADVGPRSIHSVSQPHSPSAGQLSISRSDSEEDVSGSFLGPRIRNKKQGQRQGNRSANPLSTTPPSITSDGNMMKLDEAVKCTGPYKPQQVMAIGHAPSAIKRDVFHYLSSRYLHRLARDLHETALAGPEALSICDRIRLILEYFAKSAEDVGQFRLAQTWRIFSYTMGLLLTRRAHYHKEIRLARRHEKRTEREKQDKKAINDDHRLSGQYLQEEMTPRKSERPKSPRDGLPNPFMKSILTEEMESTSNMTTPQARPVRDSLMDESTISAPVLKIDDDKLDLPPSVQQSGPSPMKVPERSPEKEAPASSVDGYDFYGMDGLTTAAIDISAPLRKPPFRLDDFNYKDQREYPRVGSLARHDSNESFQMFSSSGDSNPKKFPGSSESCVNGSLPHVPHRSVPEFESSWESSNASSTRRRNGSFIENDNNNSNIEYEYDSPGMSQLPPTLRVHRASLDRAHESEDGENELQNRSERFSEDEEELSLEIVERDYLPRPSDPPLLPSPIDPHLLVQRTIQFETQMGSLNAGIMVLLLKPLLAPGTVDDIQSAAILRQLHHRLDGMMLFAEAALLRNLCYPLYPSVYSQGQPKNIGSMGYFCTTCEKPVQEGDLALGQRMQKCHRCNTYFAGCAVCNLSELPSPSSTLDDSHDPQSHEPEDPSSSASSAAPLWWWCQGCGHGGHTACLRSWHAADGTAFSDGCCPLDGCLHPCLPGKWRTEFLAGRRAPKSEELGRLVKEGTRGGPKGVKAGGVRRDRIEVGESRAVESVRGALGGASVGGGTAGVGAGTGLERKKSVKVVAPGEK